MDKAQVVRYGVRSKKELETLMHIADMLPLKIRVVSVKDGRSKTIEDKDIGFLFTYGAPEYDTMFITPSRLGRLDIFFDSSAENAHLNFVRSGADGDVVFYFKDDVWEGNIHITELKDDEQWW